MRTVDAPETLTGLIIGLVVDEVPLLISVDDLVHLVFPNKFHIDDIALLSSFELLIRELFVRDLATLFSY